MVNCSFYKVTADVHPQWRKIVWSDDSSCFAVANRYCMCAV